MILFYAVVVHYVKVFLTAVLLILLIFGGWMIASLFSIILLCSIRINFLDLRMFFNMGGMGGRGRDGPVDTKLYDILGVKPSATEDEIKKVVLWCNLVKKSLLEKAGIF